MKMTEAASQQAVDEGKRRLRDFLESSDTGRQAMAMSSHKDDIDGHEMSKLDKNRRSGNSDDSDGF